MVKYDFGGYATKNDVRCSDGRKIKRDAFKDCDGKKVPLVYQHLRDDPNNIIGHAILENRPDGVYAYGKFNSTDNAKTMKECVVHGDIDALSIYANHLSQNGNDVTHGAIREVSLVVAGANPGAKIDNIWIQHADGEDEMLDGEAIIFFDTELEHSGEFEMEDSAEYDEDDLEHARSKSDYDKLVSSLNSKAGKTRYIVTTGKGLLGIGTVYKITDTDSGKSYTYNQATKLLMEGGTKSLSRPELEKRSRSVSHSDDEDDQNEGKAATVKEVFDSLTEDQKILFYAMVGQALEEGADDEEKDEEMSQSDYDEGGNTMHENVFEGNAVTHALSHADRVEMFNELQHYADDHNMKLSKAFDDYRDSFLQHGITDIESLFPDYKSLDNPPAWIGAPEAWVNTVWNGTSKTPFSRIKSAFADITKDEARARGYIKGKKKEEEQFSLLRRTTDPQTVYKLQKLDRDDIIDITDFDVVAWLKSEMRMKLQEELSRAILIGDGRLASAEQKIQENHIRPILTDDDFYTLKYKVDMTGKTDSTDRANAVIDAAAYAVIDYKGSGGMTAFMSPNVLADLRVAKDKNGRRLYTSTSEIASALGVSNIVEVPLMKGLTRTGTGDDAGKTYDVHAILVNLRDYNVGADRGGQTTMFDDFDIDYNKYTYLIETRCSGALIRPASAIVLETESASGASEAVG